VRRRRAVAVPGRRVMSALVPATRDTSSRLPRAQVLRDMSRQDPVPLGGLARRVASTTAPAPPAAHALDHATGVGRNAAASATARSRTLLGAWRPSESCARASNSAYDSCSTKQAGCSAPSMPSARAARTRELDATRHQRPPAPTRNRRPQLRDATSGRRERRVSHRIGRKISRTPLRDTGTEPKPRETGASRRAAFQLAPDREPFQAPGWQHAPRQPP
jgi:hypothetical protein